MDSCQQTGSNLIQLNACITQSTQRSPETVVTDPFQAVFDSTTRWQTPASVSRSFMTCQSLPGPAHWHPIPDLPIISGLRCHLFSKWKLKPIISIRALNFNPNRTMFLAVFRYFLGKRRGLFGISPIPHISARIEGKLYVVLATHHT